MQQFPSYCFILEVESNSNAALAATSLRGGHIQLPFFHKPAQRNRMKPTLFLLRQHSSPTHLTCQGQVAADHTLPKEVDASGVNVPRHCSVPKGLKVKDFSKVAWKQKHLCPRAFLI